MSTAIQVLLGIQLLISVYLWGRCDGIRKGFKLCREFTKLLDQLENK